MRNVCKLILFAWSILWVTHAQAQNGSLSGYMFGDAYYVAANHDSELEGENGFWFRRIYFTYDHTLNEEFAVRFRLELNSPGDFETRARLEPYLKDGYLRWKKSGHAVILGLSSTPMWNYLEDVWGYRSVEKTPADLYDFGSSRDFGIAVKGKLDAAKKTHYHFMLSNGSSTRSETNAGKKVALALGHQLPGDFSVEVYGDFEERPGRTNRYSAQGFLGYAGKTYRLGAQFLHQTRQVETGGEVHLQVGSVFATAQLREKLWGLARYDRTFDAIADGPDISYLPLNGESKVNFLLLGVDYQPHEQVHFMPNVEIVIYDSTNGTSPDADIIPRLTFYYGWN